MSEGSSVHLCLYLVLYLHLHLVWFCTSVWGLKPSPECRTHGSLTGLTEPQHPQPVTALGEMFGEINAMHLEQAVLNRQQLEAVCTQTEAQTQLLQELLAWSGAGAPSPPPHALLGVVLHKLTAEDDPQSFLDMFEATAVVCGWLAAEWAVRLLPLLSGEAQTAALSLLASARGSFQALRKAQFWRPAREPRRRPRPLIHPTHSFGPPLHPALIPLFHPLRPFTFQPLWALPSSCSGLHKRQGRSAGDAGGMEVSQVVRVTGPPTPSPSPWGTYSVPVRIQGGIHRPMVDSGCMQSTIHLNLVQPGALVEASLVDIKCMHGDIHSYPMVPVEIRHGGKKNIALRLQLARVWCTPWFWARIGLGLIVSRSMCGDALMTGRDRGYVCGAQWWREVVRHCRREEEPAVPSQEAPQVP